MRIQNEYSVPDLLKEVSVENLEDGKTDIEAIVVVIFILIMLALGFWSCLEKFRLAPEPHPDDIERQENPEW